MMSDDSGMMLTINSTRAEEAEAKNGDQAWPDDMATCGELSCDECNARTLALTDEVARLTVLSVMLLQDSPRR